MKNFDPRRLSTSDLPTTSSSTCLVLACWVSLLPAGSATPQHGSWSVWRFFPHSYLHSFTELGRWFLFYFMSLIFYTEYMLCLSVKIKYVSIVWIHVLVPNGINFCLFPFMITSLFALISALKWSDEFCTWSILLRWTQFLFSVKNLSYCRHLVVTELELRASGDGARLSIAGRGGRSVLFMTRPYSTAERWS